MDEVPAPPPIQPEVLDPPDGDALADAVEAEYTRGPYAYHPPDHQAVFEAWYARGRATRQVAAEFDIKEQTLRQWARDEGWHQRANERDQEALRRADREAIKRRSRMLIRQREAGELLLLRGTERLHKAEIKKDSDAIAAIKAGIEIYRQAEGLPNWVGQIIGAEDQELETIVAELDARRRAALGPGYEDPGGAETPEG